MTVISPSISGIKYVIHNENDVIQHQLLHGIQWNDVMVTLIKKYISERNLCHLLNVGSHIGSVCLPISLHIDKVTAIEAYPTTYKHLCENIELNQLTNVSAINVAVGNSEEDVYFMSIDKICPVEHINRVKNNSGGMHVFTEKDIVNNTRSAVLTDKKISNKINKLDNLHTQVDSFDIMLVDIEGFEYDFLLGAEHTIKRNRPIIIIEIWDNHKRKMENMAQSQEEVVDYIRSLGYNVVGNNGDDFIFEPL